MAISDYVPFIKPAAPKFVTESGDIVHGIMAEFDTPADIYHAAEKMRDSAYSKWDAFSPFPMHGLDEAMGVKRTILPVLVAFGAFTGVGLAYLMQWWMTSVDFPVVVQGKPYGAWEPFIPITFELGVLFSAFASLLGMLALNGLPRFNHPLFNKERFLRVSDDRFVIAIEADDPKFHPQETRAFLESIGGNHIDLVEDGSVDDAGEVTD
jgi:Alternative complex III, ActD subunit